MRCCGNLCFISYWEGKIIIVLVTCYDIKYYCCRTTIYTEYTVLNQSYIDAGNSNFKDVVHYTHFCSAWYAYLELLDIDYSCGFQCSNCGPYPSLVVMDATALSFRRQFDFWSNIFTRHQEIDKVIIPKGR